jgi:hypothetical protein
MWPVSAMQRASWRRELGYTTATVVLAVLAATATTGDSGLLGLAGRMSTILFGVAVAYWLTSRAPVAMAVALIAATALVPIYWSPAPGELIPVALTPAMALGALLAPVAATRWPPGKLNVLDGLVAVLLLLTTVSSFANYDYSAQLVLTLTLRVGLLYVAVRLIAVNRQRLMAISVVTVCTAGFLGYLGLVERIFTYNVFLEVRTPGYLADVWATYYVRFGAIRAAASFGQPIPFGIFLAISTVLCAVLLGLANKNWHRIGLATALLGTVAGLWATQTRGPLAVAVLGYLFVVLGGRRINWWRQFVLPGAILVGVAVTTPLGAQLTLFWQATLSGSASDRTFTSSTQYRGTLFNALTDAQNWSLWGLARGNLFDQTAARGVFGSVDNEYLLRLLQYGGLNVIVFVIIGLAVLWASLNIVDPLARAWAAGVAATYLTLSTVALLLQQSDFFWIGVAVTAASWPLRGSRPDARNPDLVAPAKVLEAEAAR